MHLNIWQIEESYLQNLQKGMCKTKGRLYQFLYSHKLISLSPILLQKFNVIHSELHPINSV